MNWVVRVGVEGEVYRVARDRGLQVYLSVKVSEEDLSDSVEEVEAHCLADEEVVYVDEVGQGPKNRANYDCCYHLHYGKGWEAEVREWS